MESSNYITKQTPSQSSSDARTAKKRMPYQKKNVSPNYFNRIRIELNDNDYDINHTVNEADEADDVNPTDARCSILDENESDETQLEFIRKNRENYTSCTEFDENNDQINAKISNGMRSNESQSSSSEVGLNMPVSDSINTLEPPSLTEEIKQERSQKIVPRFSVVTLTGQFFDKIQNLKSPRKVKEFDAEKLKPYFIQFEEPVQEITELDLCNNILLFIMVITGLTLVFVFGIGVAKLSSFNS